MGGSEYPENSMSLAIERKNLDVKLDSTDRGSWIRETSKRDHFQLGMERNSAE